MSTFQVYAGCGSGFEYIQVYPARASFPAVGQTNVLYHDNATGDKWSWDGSAYVILGGGGGGTGTVTSVGVSSTTAGVTIGDSPVTSAGVITINIATASETNPGLLTAAKYVEFDAKQDELVSGTNIKSVNGITLLGAGDLEVGTVTEVGLTSATPGVTITGSPVTTDGDLNIEIGTADVDNPGLLSSEDWNTFNDKQDELISGTNIKTINGNSLLGAGDLVIGGGGGTGTENYVAKFNADGDVTDSNIFQTGNQVRVNTTTGLTTFFVDGAIGAKGYEDVPCRNGNPWIQNETVPAGISHIDTTPLTFSGTGQYQPFNSFFLGQFKNTGNDSTSAIGPTAVGAYVNCGATNINGGIEGYALVGVARRGYTDDISTSTRNTIVGLRTEAEHSESLPNTAKTTSLYGSYNRTAVYSGIVSFSVCNYAEALLGTKVTGKDVQISNHYSYFSTGRVGVVGGPNININNWYGLSIAYPTILGNATITKIRSISSRNALMVGHHMGNFLFGADIDRGSKLDVTGTSIFEGYQYIVKSTTENPTPPANSVAFYVEDAEPGNAAPHFKTQNGDVVKLYQQDTAVTQAVFNSPGAGNTIKTDDTFDGYTLGQIVKALRNTGILQ